MKTHHILPAMVLSLLTLNSWSQTLGIPALRVTGEDIESDQKVLWVEGENFFQGTCPATLSVQAMNKDSCKIHTKIPLTVMKPLLGVIHAQTREAEIKLMIKAADEKIKKFQEVAAVSKKIQGSILSDVEKSNPEIGNLVMSERGTTKRLEKVITLLSSGPLVNRAKKELADFPERIKTVQEYNTTSYIDIIDGNTRSVENNAKDIQNNKKNIPALVTEVEDYMDILKAPYNLSTANSKYFKKFTVPKVNIYDIQIDYDYSKYSWNFKVLNIIAEYEQKQVQNGSPVGYLAYLQKINQPVTAAGKKWAVISRSHALLGKKVANKRREFDYFYLTDWLDSEQVENLGMNKLSPHSQYTCAKVFGPGWKSPSIKEIDAAAAELRASAIGNLIADKTIISSQRYVPNPDYVNSAYMFNMRSDRSVTKTSYSGGARLCVQK